MQEKLDVSVLIPLRDREADVDRCVDEVARVLDASGLSWEAVLVDDGSRDRTWERLTLLRDRDVRVALVRLSPPAGEQAALWVGLRYCHGSAVIPYDADLRCAPESLPDLALEVLAGHDVVTGVQVGDEEEVEAGEADPSRIGPGWFREKLLGEALGVHLEEPGAVMAYARDLAHRLAELPPGGLVLPVAALRRATAKGRVPVACRRDDPGAPALPPAGERAAQFLDAWAHGRESMSAGPFLAAAAAFIAALFLLRSGAVRLAWLVAAASGISFAVGIIDTLAAWRRAGWRRRAHPRIVEILPARSGYPSGAKS
jgi:hypothetical protein